MIEFDNVLIRAMIEEIINTSSDNDEVRERVERMLGQEVIMLFSIDPPSLADALLQGNYIGTLRSGVTLSAMILEKNGQHLYIH
jgi:hypothetical protein